MSARPIDWRFLLPGPSGDRFDRLVLLGGTPAIAQTILDLGVAAHVTTAIEPGVAADAIVGLCGSTRLADAARTLREDGVLYWEIDRRTPWTLGITPSRLCRQLQTLGLTPCASYSVSHSFSRRTMYLPFERDEVFEWYLQTLFRASTRLRRMARATLAATANGCGLAAIAPCYAITAARGVARPPSVLSKAAAAGIPLHADTTAVFLTHGSTEWNRVVTLLFEPGSRAPLAAIKLPRTAAFSPEIDWEHNVLRAIRSELSRELAGSLPRSRVFRWNGLSVSAETCVTGVSLSGRPQGASSVAMHDLGAVVQWLADFHRQTTVARVPAKRWARKHLDRASRRYSATFGVTDAEVQLFDGVGRAIDRLVSETLPIVWQHGDLHPSNIYIDRGNVSVIDWETARRGPALQDLLYLMTDWTAAVTGRTSDAPAAVNFRELYCSKTDQLPLFTFVHRDILRYMRAVGVPETLFQPLLVLTLLEKALERVSRLRTMGSSSTDVGHEPGLEPNRDVEACRQGNRFVAFLGILASHISVRPMPAHVVTNNDITVAVATMNRPEALARCLEAILNAHRLPGELVVVDQSESSAALQIIKQVRRHGLLPVEYIRQPRRGLAASRNLAIYHASRPIIAFTDDDCVADSQWLSAIVEAFNTAERPDVVTGRVLPLGPDRPDRFAVSTRASRVAAIYRGRTLPWSVGSGGNAAVKREWLERVGAFDERLGAGSAGQSAEDIDLFYRLLREGATVRYDPRAVIYHERKSAEGRLASRPAYGFGMGAFCALAVRRADPFAVCMLTRWCYDRARALAGACIKRHWRKAREEYLMLRGAVAGVGRGMSRTVGG